MEYAMTANSAWARSPSAPKEENNHYQLFYVECVLCTLLSLGFILCMFGACVQVLSKTELSHVNCVNQLNEQDHTFRI